MNYDEFKAIVRDLSLREDLPPHGLVSIPELRRECGARLSRADFDAFLVRLHSEGAVHLLSHVEFDRLPPDAQQDALRLPSGQDLYWIRWL